MICRRTAFRPRCPLADHLCGISGRIAAGRGWFVIPVAIAMFTVAMGLTGSSATAQVIRVPANPNSSQPAEEDPYGVYLPSDRTLTRGMTRAKERLNAGEYNEALAFLQQLLDRNDDVFVEDPADANRLGGLKASARKLIAALPAAGREMYNLLHTADARRALDAALASGDRDQLAELVRRYFLTEPGYEAALILAQIELDRGHPLAAAHLYQQLIEDPTASTQFEPQLSLLSAAAWRAAGKPNVAAAVLRVLLEKHPAAEVEIKGQKTTLPKSPQSDDQLVAWLDQALGRAQSAAVPSDDWLTTRGAPDRNTNHPGGAPHLSPRWESRVVNDPRFEQFLTSRREQTQQQGLVAFAAARPIAAGNVVLMRTPVNVVALDWQTGKRIWETREEETAARDKSLADYFAAENAEDAPPMSHPLEQRVWEDTLLTSISSDGERVYSLDGIEPELRDEQVLWSAPPGFAGGPDGANATTNRLTACDLATEGKLLWKLDGGDPSSELAGAFFLGAPLAFDGSLYVLAEIRSAIYLLSLEPKTGKLLWRQQLVGLEQGIMLDPERRETATAPSYADGILVCPTSAGMVVAIDTVRREFAWVYRYPRQVDPSNVIRPGWQPRSESPLPRGNHHWLENATVISEGRVLLTPTESTEIHCLDLASGQLLWKKPREKSLYLAGVDEGKAILVGSDAVRALRLSDGSPAWSHEVVLPTGAMPSGIGYLSEGRYYLPLSNGAVAAITTQDGVLASTIESPDGLPIGNLICHRGSVISQSALFVDKFEQIEVLRERAEAALAANPRDATAIRDLAEIRRMEGNLAESVRMLKEAHAIDPTDSITRDMLAETLLAALAADYAAYQADLPLLREIVFRPQQQIELYRLDALGLAHAGQTLEAFNAYLRFADATSATPIELAISPVHSVRSDAWIQSQLSALWTSATDADRDKIAAELAARRAEWQVAPSKSDRENYLAVFGGLPDADAVRLQRVRALLSGGEALETELALIRLGESRDKQMQATAAVLLANWLIDEGRSSDARQIAAQIRAWGGDLAAVDGKTPQQWLDHWQPEFMAVAAAEAWPRGRVTSEEISASARNRRELTRTAQIEFQLGLRRLRIEQESGPAFGPQVWLISQDGSRLIGRDGLNQDVFRYGLSRGRAMQRFTGNAEHVQAAQLGDLMFATLGGRVVALDTRSRADDDDTELLWQSSSSNRAMLPLQLGNRRNAASIYHLQSQRKRMLGAAVGMAATLGPATASRVVYLDQQKLRAVDPLSGEILWSRTDIPAGSELFGDADHLLAADPETATLFVLRMNDGTQIDKRPLPEVPWLLTAGRNYAELADPKPADPPNKVLRVVDALSGQTLLRQEFDASVRITTLEPNYVAAVESSGRLRLLDIRTAKPVIDETLQLADVPRELRALRTGDQLFVGVNSRKSNARQIGLDYPIVSGQVFAFDLPSGRAQWSVPAVISERGLAINPPDDLPLLFFVDRQSTRDSSGAAVKLRLLCLDKTTGATIYRNDDLPDTAGGQFRIRARRDETPTIDIEMSARTIRLKFTDQPRSPEPPTNDLVEAPRKSLGRGLLGVGIRIGNAIQDALQNPGANRTEDTLDLEGDADDD